MLIPLLAFVPLVTAPVIEVAPADVAAPPPIQLWINSDRRFRVGERVKIQVETGTGGHLLVLQLHTDGSLRVLFPIAPTDETFVEAGRRYEVRDPRSGESFVADDDGVGLIYSAIAADPYRFDAWLDSNGDWNPSVLSVSRETEDPEADMSSLVQQLVSQAGFDYDVLDYLVMGRSRVVAQNAPPPPGWWSPLWDEYYDYCYSCAGYSGVYVSLGYGGWYWPSYWYRPWYYSYYGLHGYYPGYWGYDYGFRGGYRGRITVRPRGSVPVIVGRPRGYDVGHLGDRARPAGNRGADAARGRNGNAPAARPTRQAGGTNDRPRARPVTREGTRSGGQAVSRPAGGESSGSRPSSGSKPAARPRPRPRTDAATTQATTQATTRSTRSSSASQPVNVTRSRPDSRGQNWVRVPSQATTRATSPAAPTARRARPVTSERSVRTVSSRGTSSAALRTSPSARSTRARPSVTRPSRSVVTPTVRRAVSSSSRAAVRPSPSRSAARPSSSRPAVSRSPSAARGGSRPSASSSRSRPRPKN